jgi:hypothetical protein
MRNDPALRGLAQRTARNRRHLMKKVVFGLVAAAALAATSFAPVPAKADPISAWWLAPAILGGIFVGSAASANRAYAYGQPYAYAQPYGYASNCRVVRERVGPRRYREVEVCR